MSPEDADELQADDASRDVAWECVGSRLAGIFASAASETSESESEEVEGGESMEDVRENYVVDQKVDARAWEQVGRRIAGVFSAAAEESEEEDEEFVKADPVAWREVATRMAAVFAAAAEEDESDRCSEAMEQTPTVAEVEATKASSGAAKAIAMLTPAPTETTAPGSMAPSDRVFDDDEDDCSDDEGAGADADSAPQFLRSPAFSVLLSVRLDGEAPLLDSVGAHDETTPKQQEHAVLDPAERVPSRLVTEAQAELRAESW